MLSIVQTVGIIVAALASGYAVAASELSRRLDARRARVERVLESMLQLAEAALRMQEIQGQGVEYEVARRRLDAELKVVGVKGFESTELMTRKSSRPQEVADQSGAAIFELGVRLDELAPRPLVALWFVQARRRVSREGRMTLP